MINYCTILLIFIIFVFSSYVLYKKYIRPKFPANVTCWFCGTRTSVPYVEANSFECPSCEQYNGFNEDGDYNRPIPAQYDEMRNGSTPCKADEYIGGVDVLCDRCKQNQLLKTKQLANFVPYNEENYLWEVSVFERHMEKVYRLCPDCEEKVQKELGMQDEVIARGLSSLDSSDRTFHQIDNTDMNELNSSIIDKPRNYRTIASRILLIVSLLCGLGLLLCKVDSGHAFWPVHWSVMLQPVLLWLDRHAMMLAGAGLLSWVIASSLMYIEQSVSIFDVIGCPMWLFLLLIQTGFIPYTDMSTMYDLACNISLAITSLFCLGLKRNRRDLMDIRIIRSPTVSPRPFQEEYSESEEEEEATGTGGGSSRSNTDVTDLTNRLSGLDSWINKGMNSRTSLPSTYSGRFTPIIRNNPPVFPRTLPGTRTRESHSRSRRPLISPASFKYTSTPSRHKFGTGSHKFGNNYGLFSVRGAVQTNLDVRHVFCNPPKLMPERPATPIVQCFGEPPFQTLSMDETTCFTTIDPLRSTEIVAEEKRSSDIEERDGPEEVPGECGDTVDNLVDRLVGLPVFTNKEPSSLRRSDSGYFSCVSDSDIQVSAVSTSQCDILSNTPKSFGPRQLIRSANFEYQLKPPTHETAQHESIEPINVPERGWKTLENSKTLLPKHRYFTRFGSAPYKDIIISEET